MLVIDGNGLPLDLPCATPGPPLCYPCATPGLLLGYDLPSATTAEVKLAEQTLDTTRVRRPRGRAVIAMVTERLSWKTAKVVHGKSATNIARQLFAKWQRYGI